MLNVCGMGVLVGLKIFFGNIYGLIGICRDTAVQLLDVPLKIKHFVLSLGFFSVKFCEISVKFRRFLLTIFETLKILQSIFHR
jgi:hypothetical protein